MHSGYFETVEYRNIGSRDRKIQTFVQSLFFPFKKTVLINLLESRPWKKLKNMYRSQIYSRKVLYITLLLLHNVVLVECNLLHSNLFLRNCTLKVETIFVIQKKWKINTEALLLTGTVYFSVKRFMMRTRF